MKSNRLNIRITLLYQAQDFLERENNPADTNMEVWRRCWPAKASHKADLPSLALPITHCVLRRASQCQCTGYALWATWPSRARPDKRDRLASLHQA